MVGKINVIFTPEVIRYLDELVHILYRKEYFGFLETAEEYIFKIYDAVSENWNAYLPAYFLFHDSLSLTHIIRQKLHDCNKVTGSFASAGVEYIKTENFDLLCEEVNYVRIRNRKLQS